MADTGVTSRGFLVIAVPCVLLAGDAYKGYPPAASWPGLSPHRVPIGWLLGNIPVPQAKPRPYTSSGSALQFFCLTTSAAKRCKHDRENNNGTYSLWSSVLAISSSEWMFIGRSFKHDV